MNLIPELELIIGKQPPVPELPPQETQNRFQAVFRRFLCVFAQKEHPLTLFIDDPQWLDVATLRFIEHLLTHPDAKHLLIVGARIEHRDLDAMRLYEQAIQSARENGLIQNEALAYEIAARFYWGYSNKGT